MCYRTTYTFECEHSEDVTLRCRGQWSNIIPKRCLPGLKLPTTHSRRGLCMACSIKKSIVQREERQERLRMRLEQAGEEARRRRAEEEEGCRAKAEEEEEEEEKRPKVEEERREKEDQQGRTERTKAYPDSKPRREGVVAQVYPDSKPRREGVITKAYPDSKPRRERVVAQVYSLSEPRRAPRRKVDQVVLPSKPCEWYLPPPKEDDEDCTKDDQVHLPEADEECYSEDDEERFIREVDEEYRAKTDTECPDQERDDSDNIEEGKATTNEICPTVKGQHEHVQEAGSDVAGDDIEVLDEADDEAVTKTSHERHAEDGEVPKGAGDVTVEDAEHVALADEQSSMSGHDERAAKVNDGENVCETDGRGMK